MVPHFHGAITLEGGCVAPLWVEHGGAMYVAPDEITSQIQQALAKP
jgi:hypothetical protein